MRKSVSYPGGLLFLLSLHLMSNTVTLYHFAGNKVIIHSLLSKSEHILWFIAGLPAWSKINLSLLIFCLAVGPRQYKTPHVAGGSM